MNKEKKNNMKFCLLASSSKGNATYIEQNNTKVLIDLGMSASYVEQKLKEIEVNPKELAAILITHTHSDHIKGLDVFYKKYKTNIYITKPMENDLLRMTNIKDFNYLKEENNIKDINFKIMHLSHDSEDTIGFIFEDKLVYITDTGYININHYDKIKNKKAYIFESNHDVEMLMNGPYPFYLQQRIISDEGHLSNHDSAYHLSKIIGDNTKYIILAHISEKNNDEIKILEEHNKVVDRRKHKLIIAKPKEKTEIIEV